MTALSASILLPASLYADSTLQSGPTPIICLNMPDLNCLVFVVSAAGFPVLVIHGRNDKLASAANAEALARRLNAPCVIL